MNAKKSAFLSAIVGVILIASPVLARENESSFSNAMNKVGNMMDRLEDVKLPAIESSASASTASFFIGPQGDARIIGGEITAISGNTLTIKVWGMSISVNDGSAQFIPSGASAASVSVGGKVNVRGKMGTDGVLVASLVNVLNTSSAPSALCNRISKLIEQLRALQAKFGLPLTPLPASCTPTPTPTPTPPPADTTPPVISLISADNITQTGARINWATNETADSAVWYSTTTPVTTASPAQMSFLGTLLTTHQLTLSSLIASTTYHYIVVSKDAAGNSATSSESLFTTTP